MRAIVEGRIQIRKNEHEERVYINPEVIANNVQFIDWPNDQKNNIEKEESIV
jgi:single-strand DNA-binding protein